MPVESLTDAKPTDASSPSVPEDANASTSSVDESVEDTQSTFDTIEQILESDDGDVEDAHDLDTDTESEKEDDEEDESTDKSEEESASEKTVNNEETVSENIEDDMPKEFHEHPRFKELIAQKNEFKEQVEQMQARNTELETKTQYYESFGEETLNSYIEFLSKSVSEPMEAIKQIQPMLNDLAERAGLRLSPEMRQKVEDGEITHDEATARQKLMAENAQLKQRQQYEEQAKQQSAAEARKQELIQVALTWEKATSESDPDYPQIQKLFSDVVLADFTKNGWPQKEEIPGRLKSLYSTVKNTIGVRKPEEKTVVKGSPTPRGKEKKVYSSAREIIDDILG